MIYHAVLCSEMDMGRPSALNAVLFTRALGRFISRTKHADGCDWWVKSEVGPPAEVGAVHDEIGLL